MTPKNADCPKKTRILIVDDESNLTNLYQKILENESSDIRKCSCADQAIIELFKNSNFDLIILDLGMPGLSGIQLFQYVENYYPHLKDKVTFITAGSWDADSEQFIVKNKKKTILKPFDLEELQRHLKIN